MMQNPSLMEGRGGPARTPRVLSPRVDDRLLSSMCVSHLEKEGAGVARWVVASGMLGAHHPHNAAAIGLLVCIWQQYK